jgi:radical SAM superfamily enzyme YgiQ (UPF0313 family)
VLLLSTYELGRQPFGLASPAAWLRAAGHHVTCLDTARQRVDDETIRSAERVGLYLPMHTATRLAVPLIARIRQVNPAAAVCAFGLYAPLNEALLREAGVSGIFGGEFEQDLTDWISADGPRTVARGPSPLARLSFRVPDRAGLPPLSGYASLQMPDGTRRITGYTEASRGCKHWCRHCPIVPVYQGRFRIVPPEIVVEDVRAQVAAGAQHITFGDPDFFNGIGHALAVARALARKCPGVTYDVTIKVEHLLKHKEALPALAETGCVMVTSAVESVDPAVLARLEKGHTREDFESVVARCRAAGLTLAPTFVPFTPWTTVEGYLELLQALRSLDLIGQVAPIQLTIRLLIPNGSRLLELADVRAIVGPFDPERLVHPWRHPDPRVDALQAEVEELVGARPNAPRGEVFARVWGAAHRAAGQAIPDLAPMLSRSAVPFLTEPWYC